MWQVLHSALQPDPESLLPFHESQECLANHFVTFFSDKITKVRDSFLSTDSFTLTVSSDLPKIEFFKTVAVEDIHKAIIKSPTKFCLLHPWPTFLLKECLDILLLLPSITQLVNCSLSEGVSKKLLSLH